MDLWLAKVGTYIETETYIFHDFGMTWKWLNAISTFSFVQNINDLELDVKAGILKGVSFPVLCKIKQLKNN